MTKYNTTLDEQYLLGSKGFIPCSIDVEITFTFRKGYPASMTGPEEPDHYEIDTAKATKVELYDTHGNIVQPDYYGLDEADVMRMANQVVTFEILDNEQKFIDRMRGV